MRKIFGKKNVNVPVVELDKGRLVLKSIQEITNDLDSFSEISKFKIKVNEFNIRELKNSEFVGNNIDIKYLTKYYRSTSAHNVVMSAKIIFVGRGNIKYLINVEIETTASYISDKYDDIMKKYCYIYMKGMIETDEVLTSLYSYDVNFPIDYETLTTISNENSFEGKEDNLAWNGDGVYINSFNDQMNNRVIDFPRTNEVKKKFTSKVPSFLERDKKESSNNDK